MTLRGFDQFLHKLRLAAVKHTNRSFSIYISRGSDANEPGLGEEHFIRERLEELRRALDVRGSNLSVQERKEVVLSELPGLLTTDFWKRCQRRGRNFWEFFYAQKQAKFKSLPEDRRKEEILAKRVSKDDLPGNRRHWERIVAERGPLRVFEEWLADDFERKMAEDLSDFGQLVAEVLASSLPTWDVFDELSGAAKLEGSLWTSTRIVGDQHFSLVGSGDIWEGEFKGKQFRIRNLQGIQYIYALLEIPGREVRSLELIQRLSRHEPHWAVADPTDWEPQGIDSFTAQELQDEKTREHCRARLKELIGLRKKAEEENDTLALAEIDQETAAIEKQLSQATGLMGRARRFSDAEEQARVSVWQAIAYALDVLHKEGPPELADYLRARIKTGNICRYVPPTD